MISLDKLQTEVKRQKRKISEIEKEIERVEKEFNTNFDDERKEIKEQRDLADDPGLQIAIVGTIKAGKSTFINALFRENIASTEVTPETASLTKFIYSYKNKLVVKFYNENDWDKLWKSVEDSENGTETSISREEVKKEEQKKRIKTSIFREEFESSGAKNIERDYIGAADKTIEVANFEELKSKVKDYTSKQSKIHYFVKELIVYLNNEYMPKDVTIVDTPGLNDVVEYRSNITRDYIKRANAVIVCVNSRFMEEKEYSTIIDVFENVGDDKFKVIILGTQLDNFDSVKSDWEKQSAEWKRYLKHNYKSEDLLESNVIGISSKVFSDIIELEKTGNCEEKYISKIYYFAKDYGIELNKSQDKNDIIRNSDRIKSLTNIEKVVSLVKNTILSKGAEIVKNDLETRFSNMITNISNRAKSIKEGNNQSRATLDMDAKQQKDFELQKNKEIEEIETAMEELNENFEKIEEEWLNKNKQIKEAIKQ